MNELRFETGLVPYSINDKAEVLFNPTDMSFMSRIFKTFEILDEKQQDRDSASEKITNNREFFEFSRKIDAEMREIIDSAFEKPVCDDLFGSMNVYAAANGLPVWCNLIFTIIDLFDESVTAEMAKTNPRLDKYLKKYHK